MKITRVDEDKVEEVIDDLRNQEKKAKKEAVGSENVPLRLVGMVGGITADILEIMVRLQRIEDKLKEEKDG